MFVSILAIFAGINMVIAIVTFVLYGRARMKEKEQKEKLFLRIHSACLLLVFLAGIIYMFFMVETHN